MKDQILYNRLGLSPLLSCREIKKLGKKLLLRWHPDKNPPEQLEEVSKKFIQIKESLDILGDSERREEYHERGIAILNEKMVSFPCSFPHPSPFETQPEWFRYHFPQFESGFPYYSKSKEKVLFELYVESSTLKDDQNFQIIYQRFSPCTSCKCNSCKGTGLTDTLICFLCGGLGSFKNVHCRMCHGERTVFKKLEEVSISFKKEVFLKIIKDHGTVSLKFYDHDLVIIPGLKIKTI